MHDLNLINKAPDTGARDVVAADIDQVRSRWARIVIRALMHAGLPPRRAVRAACALAEALRPDSMYKTPCPDRVLDDLRIARRNRHIRAAFSGDNHTALARQYGLHERTIRKILEQE